VKPGADTGVSLIELLVVVAVLSVLAIGVSLPLRDGGSQAPADAARFASMFERTRTLAIHGQTQQGLRLTSRDMALMKLTADGWQTSRQSIRFQGRADFRTKTPANALSALDAPEIIFLPNGQTTPFDLIFFGSGSRSAVCKSDGWMGVECTRD